MDYRSARSCVERLAQPSPHASGIAVQRVGLGPNPHTTPSGHAVWTPVHGQPDRGLVFDAPVYGGPDVGPRDAGAADDAGGLDAAATTDGGGSPDGAGADDGGDDGGDGGGGQIYGASPAP